MHLVQCCRQCWRLMQQRFAQLSRFNFNYLSPGRLRFEFEFEFELELKLKFEREVNELGSNKLLGSLCSVAGETQLKLSHEIANSVAA